MEALRKGKDIIRMLGCKRDILNRDIYNADNRLSKIKYHLDENKKTLDKLNRTINDLTPTGLMTITEIYQIIRQQGLLLTDKQYIIQKICQFEQDEDMEKKTIIRYRMAISSLDKKQHKITHYLKLIRYKHLQRRNNNEENEIQEIAIYGTKNL